MARTINKVELLGRVGTDPEMKYTQGGTAVTQLRLATDRHRQDGSVEADWHSITCWSGLAEAVNQYVAKGDRLYVAGKLAQNSYEPGLPRWTEAKIGNHVIAVNNLPMLRLS